MKRVRSLLRHCALNGISLVDTILQRERKLEGRKIVQVANFHHLYEREQQAFRQFLKWYSSHYNLISYSEAVDRVKTGNVDATYGAITFDDGLKSMVSAGDILHEYGISGMFFVCPGIVGETRPNKLREFCVSAQMYYESDEFLSWEDIAKLKSQGHEIGCHTFSHPVLSGLTTRQIGDELIQSRDLLSREIGSIEHFAWPLGRFSHLGQAGACRVIEEGFISLGAGERGAHGPHSISPAGPPCIRRDNCQAQWPLSHIKHFLIANALRPIGPDQWWPSDWDIPLQSMTSSPKN